jgi:hypothetical protein
VNVWRLAGIGLLLFAEAFAAVGLTFVGAIWRAGDHRGATIASVVVGLAAAGFVALAWAAFRGSLTADDDGR